MKDLLKKLDFRYMAAGIVLVVALVSLIHIAKWLQPKNVTPQTGVQQTGQAESVYFMPPKSQGPENAPIQIIQYSDFECPSCAFAEGVLQELYQAYPDKIHLTFYHFPLTMHRWSIYAHQAAECMNMQGKFWPYHELLYQKQKEWSASAVPPVELFVRYANECRGDVEAFMGCMTDVAVTRAIYAEKDGGNARKVNATPTFFIGEQRFVGPREMKERGQNEIRKILGMPELPIPPKEEPKQEAKP